MKILIAGFGSIGRRHFRNLKTLGVEDFVFLRSRRSTLPDDEIAAYPVESEITAALAHKPDAVVVANPSALHLDVAIPSAEAGCHILMEKPISHSLERVEALQAAVERSGARVLVGFQFRFHPGLRRIQQWLSEADRRPTTNDRHPSSVIGHPSSFRAHWGEWLPGWHPWEDYRQGYAARPELGGGVILTLCHPLDYLRWMFGEVASLWAHTSNRGLGMAVEDSAEIGLRFESGVIGSVHLNYLQRPGKHTLEIVGTEGSMRWDNSDGVVQISRAAPDGSSGAWEKFPPPPGFERNSMFLEQTRHFLAVCRGEEQPACTLADGIAALKLALAAQEDDRRRMTNDR